MASDPNTITSTLARMESGGLVERLPHESDKRAHRVRLLPKGRRMFEKARKLASELQEQILGTLPQDERARFLETMEIIADACASVTQRPARRRVEK